MRNGWPDLNHMRLLLRFVLGHGATPGHASLHGQAMWGPIVLDQAMPGHTVLNLTMPSYV